MRFKQICNHPSQWLGDGGCGRGRQRQVRRACARSAEEIAATAGEGAGVHQFREMTAPLAAFLGSVFGRPGLVLHGETPVEQAQGAGRRLPGDEDGPPFFVLSLKAGGTG